MKPADRVARCFIFIPQIPFRVNFGGSCIGRCWYILWLFGIFNGHLLQFVVIWYIFPRFGILYQEKSGNPGLMKPAQRPVLYV
jgi:hypothetical protein